MSDRSTLLTTTRDTLVAHVRAGHEATAYATFARLVYTAHATEGCEAQGVRLGDLPRLGDVVVRTADDLATVTRERDELRAVGRRLLTAYGGGYFVRKPPHPWESPMVRQDHACHECAPDAEPGWRCPYHELRALLGDDTALAGAKS